MLSRTDARWHAPAFGHLFPHRAEGKESAAGGVNVPLLIIGMGPVPAECVRARLLPAANGAGPAPAPDAVLSCAKEMFFPAEEAQLYVRHLVARGSC